MDFKSAIYIVVIITVIGCGSKQKSREEDKFPQKNSVFFDSITPVDTYEVEGIEISSEKTKVYTEDGKLAPKSDIIRLTMSGDYMMDPYRTKGGEIIWVFQHMSEEMKKEKSNLQAMANKPVDLTGKNAIPFNALDMNGTPFSLKELNGQVIVLNFWFIGCAPCVAEMPDLNKLVKDYKEKEVVFLGFTFDKKDKLTEFLSKRTFDYAIIPESNEVISNYQVNVFPTNVVIDRRSKIIYHSIGKLETQSMKDLRKAVDLALAK